MTTMAHFLFATTATAHYNPCMMSITLFAESGVKVEPEIAPMIVLGVIMVTTYVLIAFEILHKAVAALTGAIAAVAAALAFGLFRSKSAVSHGGTEEFDKAVHDVIGHELGVIGVLVGTSILVDVASRSGLFHFLAIRIVKTTKGDPGKLFFFICLATLLFVTFLTIAPGTMIMVSLVLVVTRELDLDPKPYILAVALCANSGALMTLASGVCTLMLGTAAHIPYVHFFVVSTPMAIISAAVVYLFLRSYFAESLKSTGDPVERAQKVMGFDEWALVKDRKIFYRSIYVLGGTIIGFATAQSLGVGLDYIAFAGATAALLFSGFSTDEAIKKVNWAIVLFFIGLFVIIGAVRASGLLDVMAAQLSSGGNVTTAMILVAVFGLVLSGLVDNIPVAATLIPIIQTMVGSGMEAAPLWWAIILAANLGGNTTPVGSISTVIALHSLEKERKIKVGWGEFLKIGCAITVIQGILVVGYLLLYQKLNLFPKIPTSGS